MTQSLSRRTGRFTRLAVAAATTTSLVAAGLTVATITAPPAAALSARATAVTSAASYAKAHGYKVGISVLDTKTGAIYHAGQPTSGFASESVIKVMIAARLLVQGRMHGSTSTRASRMIRMSDDNIANSFYGSVGGDGLLSWTKSYFKVPSLGTGPIRSGWWGSNRLTSDGLVRLYAKLKANKKIGPWLLKAMHGHTKYGADGFYQAFGLPSATKNVAVKQGWGADYSYSSSNASQNSTGFTNGDRYAVAILARGPGSTYGAKIGNAITAMAKRLLPGGAFPSNTPTVGAVSDKTISTFGGQALRIAGRDFTGATQVRFGGTPAKFKVHSSTLIVAAVPEHKAGKVGVYVRTKFGTSTGGPIVTYGAPPVVASLSSRSGPTAGPTRVITVSGSGFTQVNGVGVGLTYAKYRVVTSKTIRIELPNRKAGSYDIRVRSIYGASAKNANDVYTYVKVAPATTRVAPTAPATTPAPTPTTTTSPDVSDAPVSAAPVTN